MNQNKPFDLQAALAGASVVNGDGTKITVTKLSVPRASGDVLVSQDNRGLIQSHNFIDGTSEIGSEAYKLYMAPVERTVWINLYTTTGYFGVSSTEAAADQAQHVTRLGGKAHMITYTE
jgi:hypothetical protein